MVDIFVCVFSCNQVFELSGIDYCVSTILSVRIQLRGSILIRKQLVLNQ